MHYIMKNCRRQEELFFVYMELFEVSVVLIVGAVMWKMIIVSVQKKI